MPILDLSRAIIRTKPEYYRLLNAVTTKGQWEEWTMYMVSRLDETARWTTAKIRSIRELMQAADLNAHRSFDERSAWLPSAFG